WILRATGKHDPGFFERLRAWYEGRLQSALHVRWLLIGGYVAAAAIIIYVLFPRLGTQVFPDIESRQIQVRLRAPTGTRLERTELIALKAVEVIRDEVGPKHVEITTSFIGVQTPNYPINTIYLFASGQHEAVLGVSLKPDAPPVTEALREQ